jgi:hypothetical protein
LVMYTCMVCLDAAICGVRFVFWRMESTECEFYTFIKTSPGVAAENAECLSIAKLTTLYERRTVLCNRFFPSNMMLPTECLSGYHLKITVHTN